MSNRFPKSDFLVHRNIQAVSVKLGNRNNFDEMNGQVTDMYQIDFKWGDPKIQQHQFSTIVGSNDISNGKLIKILSDFGKMLCSETFSIRSVSISKTTFGYACSQRYLWVFIFCSETYSYDLSKKHQKWGWIKPLHHAPCLLQQTPTSSTWQKWLRILKVIN